MQRTRKILAAAAAATVGLYGAFASASTITWTGTTRDPNSANYTVTPQGASAGFTNGQNLYLWNTSVANWSSGGSATTYAVGDDVVFTDNFSGGTVIRASSGSMNPTSMTFTHAGAGSFTT